MGVTLLYTQSPEKPVQEMTYIESPVETIVRFIPSWRNTNPERLAQEIVSSFNETHRKPDEFRYKYKDGNLVDYQTGERVNIDRSTYLGQKDAEFFDTLTSWVSENDSGVALWISPSYESSYPTNKITIYTIENTNGEKSTFNVSVLFDTPKEHTLKIASKLNDAFKSVLSPEVLRNKLFTMEETFTLVSLLELISANQYFPPTPSSEMVSYFVREIHSGRNPRSIAEEMYKNGIIGEHAVSCAGGGGAKSILEANSLVLDFGGMEDQYGSLYFSCPKCGATNMRPFGQLISNCQHCGGDVTC